MPSTSPQPPGSDACRRPVPNRRRLVLLWAVLGGVAVPVYFLGLADVAHLGWDFHAYYAAADAALAGRPFVGIDTGITGVRWVYPPPAVLLFLPQAALGGWRAAFLAQTVVNVAAALGVAYLAVRTVERHRGRLPAVDRALVAGFCLASAPVLAVLGLGQVDTLVAFAFALAFVAVEADREGVAGVALGAAALVKVFPAVLGLWLAWRRAWRALAAAVATGVAGLAAGAALFGPGAYRRYVGVLSERSRVAAFEGTVSPDFFAMTLYRPLSQALPGVDAAAYAPLAVLAVTPAVGAVLLRDRGLPDRLATFLVAVAAMVLVSPASNALYVVYAYYPLVCLCCLDTRVRGEWLLLAGVLAVAFPVQPAQVDAALAAAGVPGPLAAPVVSAAESVLSVVSVPTLGLLAVTAWCLGWTARDVRSPAPGVQPSSGD